MIIAVLPNKAARLVIRSQWIETFKQRDEESFKNVGSYSHTHNGLMNYFLVLMV